jgi:anti-anti-sigma factor
MKYVTGTRAVDPQTTVVTCAGEMDSLAVEELHQAVDPLLADSTSHLIFDFAKVDYLSSSVLSFLLAAQSKAKEKSGKVSLVGASELVKQSFEMAALDSLFEFRGTLEDAGVVVTPPASAKGKERAEKKGKGTAATKGDGSSSPVIEKVVVQRQEEKPPAREKVTLVSERRVREERRVEKLQPVGESKSWRDYAVWIGIATVAAVSILTSLYLYLYR